MPDFFESVKRGIEKGVSTVSVKSKEMLETTQLRSQVKTFQEEKQRALEELGNIVYTLYLQGKLEREAERVRAKCTALASLDQKIREKEEEIRQVQLKAQEALGRAAALSLGICDCGTPIYEGTKFCGGCGKSVEEILKRVEAGPQATGSRCSQCGAAVAPEARFCGGCGARVEAAGV